MLSCRIILCLAGAVSSQHEAYLLILGLKLKAKGNFINIYYKTEEQHYTLRDAKVIPAVGNK